MALVFGDCGNPECGHGPDDHVMERPEGMVFQRFPCIAAGCDCADFVMKAPDGS